MREINTNEPEPHNELLSSKPYFVLSNIFNLIIYFGIRLADRIISKIFSYSIAFITQTNNKFIEAV
jgi:hypothetical protein